MIRKLLPLSHPPPSLLPMLPLAPFTGMFPFTGMSHHYCCCHSHQHHPILSAKPSFVTKASSIVVAPPPPLFQIIFTSAAIGTNTIRETVSSSTARIMTVVQTTTLDTMACHCCSLIFPPSPSSFSKEISLYNYCRTILFMVFLLNDWNI